MWNSIDGTKTQSIYKNNDEYSVYDKLFMAIFLVSLFLFLVLLASSRLMLSSLASQF